MDGYDPIFEYKLNDHVLFRLYPDNRPTNLETSKLHKGLILEFKGTEHVGQGIGFGVPVVKYHDKTYFPGESRIKFDKNQPNKASKTYDMNTISKKYIKNSSISDKLYQPLHRIFTFFYLRLPTLRQVFDNVMILKETIGIHTEFIQVKSRGTITTAYEILENTIKITVQLTNLDLENSKEIGIFNEQGAEFFKRYQDSSGLVLFEKKIGAWEKVVAAQALFSDDENGIKFGLRTKPDTSLIRGWEHVLGRLSWSGLNYTFKPGRSSFTYSIEIYFSPVALPE